MLTKHKDLNFLYLLPLALFGCYLVLWRNLRLTEIAIAAFIFGGLMFGADLARFGRQFERWGILGFLWLPYQRVVSHRSLFARGLLVGTSLRWLYLALAITVCVWMLLATQTFASGHWSNWQVMMDAQTSSLLHKTKQWANEYCSELSAVFIGTEIGAMTSILTEADREN